MDVTDQMRGALREGARRSDRGTKEGFRERLAMLDLAARLTPEGASLLRRLIR